MITLALCLVAGLHVELKPEAQAHGTEVVLSEVAAVRGDDAELVARASALSIGYTPSPGFSRRLDRWALQRELAQALPSVDVAFAGAEACRILPATRTVTSTELVAAARARLVEAFSAGDVTCEEQPGTGDAVVPAGHEGYELRARLDPGAPSSGLVSVPVEVLVDGELYRTIYTSWKVEAWREAPVLVRDVGAGERMTIADFQRRRVRIGVATEQAFLTEAAADGAIAVRGLPAGSVVRQLDVRRPLLVRRGDTVQLQVKKGNIRATSTAVAADDGYLGDKIRVVTPSQRELRAVILGRELVGLELQRPL